jgi:hypothetical protein
MMEACSSRRRLLKMDWLILALLVLAGCGSGKPGTVEGKVTLDGTPVAGAASVYFTCANGEVRAVPVRRDGFYRALLIPVGAVKVYVTPSVTPTRQVDRGKKKGPDEPEAPSARSVQIPKKYTDAETSGLSTTVHSGTNTYDIELSSQ